MERELCQEKYIILCFAIVVQQLFSAPRLPCYNQSRNQLFRHFHFFFFFYERGYVIYSTEKNKEDRAM